VTGGQLARLGRTVVHLRGGQVAHRARLRAQRAALIRWPQAGRILLAGPGPATPAGWPASFVPLDGRAVARWPGLADLRSGQIRLLGMERALGVPPDWTQSAAPQLWRFHLQYWDWAWGLVTHRDLSAARETFAELWLSWHGATTVGHGDAWRPYPAALRAWSWCGLHGTLAAGSEIEDRFVASLAIHAGFLRRYLELDVGGNHLVKNLKALAGLAVFFADERLLNWTLARLTAQLAVQVLPDGGHFERAPAYHCQVLGDLIDVADLLRAAGKVPPAELDAAIGRMRDWLGVVLSPDGLVPLLNDGYPVDPELLGLLDAERGGPEPLRELPATGLVRAAAGGWDLLADVGPPCPDELPAHAHADSLGCIVHLDGVPLLVDTGTSTYVPGPVRDHERSTAAHNTVEVDGTDSTEVWGGFRAGRRARVRDVRTGTATDGIVVSAAHDGFRHLPGRPLHRRRWTVTDAGLRVEDEVTGRGRHVVVVRWHLAPGSAARLSGPGAQILTAAGPVDVGISATAPATVSLQTADVAAGFGQTVPAPVLTCQVEVSLPVQISTSWCRERVTSMPAHDRATSATASHVLAVAAEGTR
jgi:uncharacterized heparinase superfamily protein